MVLCKLAPVFVGAEVGWIWLLIAAFCWLSRVAVCVAVFDGSVAVLVGVADIELSVALVIILGDVILWLVTDPEDVPAEAPSTLAGTIKFIDVPV